MPALPVRTSGASSRFIAFLSLRALQGLVLIIHASVLLIIPFSAGWLRWWWLTGEWKSIKEERGFSMFATARGPGSKHEDQNSGAYRLISAANYSVNNKVQVSDVLQVTMKSPSRGEKCKTAQRCAV